MSDKEFVTISELCERVGIDKSNLRKWAISRGFEFIKIRTEESRGQLTLALPLEEAEMLIDMREKEGYTRNSVPVIDNGNGYFYIIQLVPDLSPNRVKLGFSNDITNRLNAHRTSAPTAELLKHWPCKKKWELAAMDSITRKECTLIASEVFECENLENLINRADDFFNIMP